MGFRNIIIIIIIIIIICTRFNILKCISHNNLRLRTLAVLPLLLLLKEDEDEIEKKRDRVACTFTATGDVYSYCYVLKSPDVHSFVVKATRDESFFVFVFFPIFVPVVAHKCPVATVDDFIVVVAIAVRSYR